MIIFEGCDLNIFPELPTYSAKWVPIYFEPILFSGEKITIAVGVKGADGAIRVAQVLRENILTCMYGKKSKNAQSIIDWSVKSLEDHLNSQGNFEDWKAPFEGISIGDVHEALDDDIQGVIYQGMRTSSSLSYLDEPLHKKSMRTEIRDMIIKKHETLAPCFNKKIKLTNSNFVTTFNFAHSKYISNFGALSYKHLPASVSGAKAKILDLQAHKIFDPEKSFEKYELILRTPRHDELMLSEKKMVKLQQSVAMLKEIAGSNDISVFTTNSHEAAADQILQNVA